jgi:hypothetical protein
MVTHNAAAVSAAAAALPAGMKVPLPFKLLGKLPHWVRMQSPLADQDTVVNAKQVRPALHLAMYCAVTTAGAER